MPKRLSEKIELRDLFRTGDSFFHGVNLMRRGSPEEWMPATQALVVCSAFCLEAYRKVLAQIERDAPPLEGHSLVDLFGDLTSSSYKRIQRTWEKGHAEIMENYRRNASAVPEWASMPTKFRDALEVSSKAFVEWRYGSSEVPKVWHIDGIAGELRRIIVERAPEVAKPQDTSSLDPQSLLAKVKNDFAALGPATGWAILNHKAAPFQIKIRTSPDSQDGGPGKGS